MSVYPPPAKNYSQFNPLNFANFESSLTLEDADIRYLKLSGGILSGQLVANGALVSNNVLSCSSGTNLLPSVTFVGDNNSGLYRIGADNIGLSTNGVKQLDIGTSSITSTQKVIIPQGATATPSICFSTSTGSGLYNPTGNALGITTNGDDRLHIHNTYIEPFHPIRNMDGSVSAPSMTFKNDTKTGIYMPSANNINMTLGGNDYLELSTSFGLRLNQTTGMTNAGNYRTLARGTAADPVFKYVGGADDTGIFFKASTNEPSITHTGNLVVEFGSSAMTLYKTLSSGVQPYSSYLRNTDQTSLISGAINTILYDTKEQEYSNRITFASGVYTVLDAGVYHIHADLQISSSGANFDLSSFFTINNSGTDRVGYIVTRAQAVHLISISNIIRLNSNDTVRVQVIPGTNATLNTTANGTRKLRFSIVRLF